MERDPCQGLPWAWKQAHNIWEIDVTREAFTSSEHMCTLVCLFLGWNELMSNRSGTHEKSISHTLGDTLKINSRTLAIAGTAQTGGQDYNFHFMKFFRCCAMQVVWSPAFVCLRWSGSSSRWWRGGSRGITNRPRPVPCQAPPTAVRPRATSSTMMPSGAVCGTLWVHVIWGNLCFPLLVYSYTQNSKKCPTITSCSEGLFTRSFVL